MIKREFVVFFLIERRKTAIVISMTIVFPRIFSLKISFNRLHLQ